MAYDEEHGVGRTEQPVDGVYVDIYDDGHVELDKDRMVDRLEGKIDVKIQQHIGGCIFNIVFGLLVLGVFAGIGAYVYHVATNPAARPAPPVSSTAPAQWDGSTPLVCSGNNRMEFSGVTANLAGQRAIWAASNCQLTLTDCNITGAVGIEAGSNAKVTMIGGSLTGSEAAVTAGANATVLLKGVKTSGPRKSNGNSSIQEKAR